MSEKARAPVVGRFAPSPTGPLHFGSLVSALASRCDALAAGGRWLVRIEDVDEPRAAPGAERGILATLGRYGFAIDGPVVRQSEREAHYGAALAALGQRGLVYPCACTRRELEDAPLSSTGERIYPGTCRDGIPADRAPRAQRSIRMRVGDASVGFVDRLQGAQQQDLAREVGDFVVHRADGLAAYQLAVVVDDALQGITHVVRGADLLASTPRQIHLQRALRLATPSYLHVPIAIAASGEKLSKQTGARALPNEPLPSLVAAWRFLEQPPCMPSTVAAFWTHAVRAWSPSRLPRVRMLPAPRDACAV
ncbi:glutamyl-Q tRNA(Asp) synthetase [Burkholderiales bacterium]|nr:glutamyl-Q tRNA(Asp) synthetase [Burkholderiales bacterium]